VSTSKLDPQLKRAVADRLEFYRDLGIYDLYRREPSSVQTGPVPSQVSKFRSFEVSETPSRETRNVETSKPIPEPALDPSSALQLIRDEIGDCRLCRLHKGRTNLVFGVGNPHAELMFIGEAPGADEDEQGIPFIGRAGQLLTNMISAMGLKRDDVYIANIIKCRPPQNRTPERDECETCSPFLMRQIATIRPKAIVALGAVAAKNLLGMNDAMANLRGRAYEFTPPGTDVPPIKLFVTYHPAYLLRDPRQKAEAWKDLQMVMRHLGLKPPAKSADKAQG
jgi:uracil-DNA glycosylase